MKSIIHICFLNFSLVAFASDLPYEFPVKPGTPEWKELSEKPWERLEACNISQEQASKLSTKALLETCLNYPLRGNLMFSSQSDIHGLDMVTRRFVGLQELLKREDAGEHVLAKYVEFPIKEAFNKENLFGNLDYRILNLLLMKDEILHDLSQSQLEQVLVKALENSVTVRKTTQSFSTEAASSRLALKILYFTGYEESRVDLPFADEVVKEPLFQGFVTGGLLRKDYMDGLIDFARKRIKERSLLIKK